MELFHIGLGAVLAVVVYLVFIACTHGLPYLWTKLKSWWTAGKAELVTIKGDVAAAQAKVTTLEQSFGNDIATLKTDMAAVKAKVGV